MNKIIIGTFLPVINTVLIFKSFESFKAFITFSLLPDVLKPIDNPILDDRALFDD